MKRGIGERCTGFYSGDGNLAFCERVVSGNAANPGGVTLYKHKLHGACSCGVQHGPALAGNSPRKAPRKAATSKPKKVHATHEKAIEASLWGLRQPERNKAGEVVEEGDPSWHEVARWTYRDAAGIAAMMMMRAENSEGRKEYRPIGKIDSGWITGDPPGKLPLYGLDRIAADPNSTVCVVEGEKSADALNRAGILATTASHGAGKADMSDWGPLAGRHVVIWPDHDQPGEAHVRSVLEQLARLEPTPTVKVIRPPNMPPKGDAADFMEAGRAADEVRQLINEAPVEVLPVAHGKEQEKEEEEKPNEAIDDPHRLARIFLESGRLDGELTARFHRDEWWLWGGGAYRKSQASEIRADLTRTAKQEFDRANLDEIEEWKTGGQKGKRPTVRKVTGAVASNMANAAISAAILPSHEGMPMWIGGDCPFDLKTALPTRSGIIDLAGAEGPVLAHPCTPKMFTSWCLPYDYDIDAAAPDEWFGFLESVWPDDPESVSALQEWFGYCLTTDCSQQKIAFFCGPTRSGKGTIGRVLKALIGGDANVAGPTIASFATNFGLEPLIGKPLAIVDDARFGSKTDIACVVERLLTISGEGTLTIDRKHIGAWTGTLPTRLVLMSNETPRLADASSALAGRFLIFRTTRSFYGDEDTKLESRLRGELAGILLWAIEGWRRLRERGHFVQPDSGQELVEEMRELSSPVAAFIREECQRAPGLEVLVSEIYSRYQSWCDLNGKKVASDLQTFARDLRAVVPDLKTVQRREFDRARCYLGISLRPSTAASRHALSRVSSHCGS
jgi:putative DNA primase/helicase